MFSLVCIYTYIATILLTKLHNDHDIKKTLSMIIQLHYVANYGTLFVPAIYNLHIYSRYTYNYIAT